MLKAVMTRRVTGIKQAGIKVYGTKRRCWYQVGILNNRWIRRVLICMISLS